MTTWIATTQDDKLADRTSDIESTNATTAADLQLDGNEYQALRGFGGCFNELGWLPLQNVSEAERDQIIKELFSPDEMNFTFNRAPVGANDFADHWYSYDEVDGDSASSAELYALLSALSGLPVQQGMPRALVPSAVA